MFRAKIPILAAIVVTAVTAGVYLTVTSLLSSLATQAVEAQVLHAQACFPALDRVRAIEGTNEAAALARDDEFGQIFAKGSPDETRQAAFVAVQTRNARLEAQGHKADLVAVVDARGHVVSRDLNFHALYDEDLKGRFPSVSKALDGVANKDIWNFDRKMYRVAAAPIRNRTGQVVGALVVGYMASAREASADKARLGTEVAYFFNERVRASSFNKGGGESAEERDLGAQLFEGPKLSESALKGELTKPFTVKINGEEYIGAAGPLPGNTTKSPSGFVVLSSLTAARAARASVGIWILLAGAVSLLVAVGATLATARRFIEPLDAVEQGVADVINGNRDYVFESPSPDYEGLANGLNVMLARLLGRPDPTDDDLGGEERTRWQGELAVDELPSGQQPSLENAQLAMEADDQYYPRLYTEYVTARRQTGEGAEGLTRDGFISKLKQNEVTLTKKYGCRMVRFKVVIRNNQTILKPVPMT